MAWRSPLARPPRSCCRSRVITCGAPTSPGHRPSAPTTYRFTFDVARARNRTASTKASYREKATRESAGDAASAQSRADQLLLRAHTFARKLLHGFDELDFLMSASEAPQGPLVVLHYTDDDPLTPYFYVLADGVVAAAPR